MDPESSEDFNPRSAPPTLWELSRLFFSITPRGYPQSHASLPDASLLLRISVDVWSINSYSSKKAYVLIRPVKFGTSTKDQQQENILELNLKQTPPSSSPPVGGWGSQPYRAPKPFDIPLKVLSHSRATRSYPPSNGQRGYASTLRM